jgi:type IV secretory pathway VirB4 component
VGLNILPKRREAAAAGLDAAELIPVPAPASLEVGAKHLAVGDWHAATLIVTGYPAEVGPGFLEPLTCYPGRLDVALHIEPVAPSTAAARLRKQRARFESGRRADAQRGRLADPEAEAAAQDAADLAYRIARGQGKIFRVGLYLTVYGRDRPDLERHVAAVKALASSMLLTTVPATFRSVAGWATTLPLGVDKLGAKRTFDTEALAAAFPFTSPDTPPADPTASEAGPGVLLGVNVASGSLVRFDRWSQENYNSLTLARSGAGKSYLTKLEILRSLYEGTQVLVIDPEDEYRRLAGAVGGAVIEPGTVGARINPFDLSKDKVGADALTARALFLHDFVGVLVGAQAGPEERAALDRAILAAYAGAGITTDPRTHTRPAPLLADLLTALEADSSAAGTRLAEHLAPYVTGSFAGLFDGPTTTRVEGHLVVVSLRSLPEQQRAAAMLLVLDALWRTVTDPGDRRRRLLVVDEAWTLMREREGSRFLARAAKSARKHWAGLAVVTQDAADVLGSELGMAVVSNAATQILLKQSPQALPAVAEAFGLSGGETGLIASAERGCGLLLYGPARIAFQTLASDLEHRLATTDPAELAALNAERDWPGPADAQARAFEGDPEPGAAGSSADLTADHLARLRAWNEKNQ